MEEHNDRKCNVQVDLLDDDQLQNQEIRLSKFLVDKGVSFMIYSVFVLFGVGKGTKIFEDTPTTLEVLGFLNVVGYIYFYWAFATEMRGLPLLVFASIGACIQGAMISICLVHFVWPGHEIAVGLISMVFVLVCLKSKLLWRFFSPKHPSKTEFFFGKEVEKKHDIS